MDEITVFRLNTSKKRSNEIGPKKRNNRIGAFFLLSYISKRVTGLSHIKTDIAKISLKKKTIEEEKKEEFKKKQKHFGESVADILHDTKFFLPLKIEDINVLTEITNFNFYKYDKESGVLKFPVQILNKENKLPVFLVAAEDDYAVSDSKKNESINQFKKLSSLTNKISSKNLNFSDFAKNSKKNLQFTDTTLINHEKYQDAFLQFCGILTHDNELVNKTKYMKAMLSNFGESNKKIYSNIISFSEKFGLPSKDLKFEFIKTSKETNETISAIIEFEHVQGVPCTGIIFEIFLMRMCFDISKALSTIQNLMDLTKNPNPENFQWFDQIKKIKSKISIKGSTILEVLKVIKEELDISIEKNKDRLKNLDTMFKSGNYDKNKFKKLYEQINIDDKNLQQMFETGNDLHALREISNNFFKFPEKNKIKKKKNLIEFNLYTKSLPEPLEDFFNTILPEKDTLLISEKIYIDDDQNILTKGFKNIVDKIIKYKIQEHCYSDFDTKDFSYKIRSKNLLGTLWGQLSTALKEKCVYKPCQSYGCPGFLKLKQRNKYYEKIFCSDRCRIRDMRKRVDLGNVAGLEQVLIKYLSTLLKNFPKKFKNKDGKLFIPSKISQDLKFFLNKIGAEKFLNLICDFSQATMTDAKELIIIIQDNKVPNELSFLRYVKSIDAILNKYSNKKIK